MIDVNGYYEDGNDEPVRHCCNGVVHLFFFVARRCCFLARVLGVSFSKLADPLPSVEIVEPPRREGTAVLPQLVAGVPFNELALLPVLFVDRGVVVVSVAVDEGNLRGRVIVNFLCDLVRKPHHGRRVELFLMELAYLVPSVELSRPLTLATVDRRVRVNETVVGAGRICPVNDYQVSAVALDEVGYAGDCPEVTVRHVLEVKESSDDFSFGFFRLLHWRREIVCNRFERVDRGVWNVTVLGDIAFIYYSMLI